MEAVNFNGKLGDDAIRLFRLWLKGDAEKWELDTEEDVKSNKWNLNDWMRALEQRFSIKKREGQVEESFRMEKEASQTWNLFYNKFKKYAGAVNKNLLT
ncbi:hypothetical protein AYI69_g6711 [Smittium culicis]|uniref:Retrotransposon gag domain-containing protein n=1 Tax=Smittium culicis TaxID=133412 RepID=A0A1R1XXA2_9FUNG|nr:hypothetical protein AYI69_g6711 [Smittium culicis]